MRSLPRVVIVGFPNVGKSTLFNRILGKRKALIHSEPGMTRDSVSASCNIEGKKFQLVDTGGLFGVEDEPISAKVRDKAWDEAAAAEIILFVLDGRRGILPAEEELYFSLKKHGKPILIVINKIESVSQEDGLAEYYRLGEKTIFPISAEHNLNCEPLLDALVEVLPSESREEPEISPLRIAIIGRINVGKSSLVNRLIGEERLLVSEIPGTTRDSTDTLIIREKRPFCLVDTAGIRRLGGTQDSREKAGIIRAKKNIRGADVICLVLDVQEFPTRQDAHVARLAYASGKPLVIALNKWDLVEGGSVDADAVRNKVYRKLGFVGYAPLLFVSAKSGQRVVKILDQAEKVHKNAAQRVETSRLNAFLADAVESHTPRAKNGERIKLRYMTQIGASPPRFVVFTNSGAPLAAPYEKYLLGLLRETFDFLGTPVRLVVRKS